MISRRSWLHATASATATLGLTPRLIEALQELQSQQLILRAIPGTAERLPVVGLGGANTFAETALRESRGEDYVTIGAVLRALVEGGGTVFDTAYGYGASEQVAGQVALDLGISDRLWWSTKTNAARVAGGVTGSADPDQAREQMRRSFLRSQRGQIDLFQVHNVGDPPTQLALLRELKEAGYVRYLGVTTTSEAQYPALIEVMETQAIDFIGIDYAVDNRRAEAVVLPLAVERRIGVLAYQPFGRTRMWERIGDRPLPEWGADFDAHSWAQLMLKFVVAHPAVTVACPGTSDPRHMADNLGAARGVLPNEEQLDRIADLVQGLPGG